MRWWLLEKNEPAGPYDLEALRDLPGFSRMAFVYPEKRLDPADERWLRAGDVPQLAVALAETERKAFSERFIVPEPTLRDLPLLGAALKQLERLEEEAVSMRLKSASDSAELIRLRSDAEFWSRQSDAAIASEGGRRQVIEEEMAKLRQSQAELAVGTRSFTQSLDELREQIGRLQGADYSAEIKAKTAALQVKLDMQERSLTAARQERAKLSEELSALRAQIEKEKNARSFFAGGKRISLPELVVLLGAVLILAFCVDSWKTYSWAELFTRRPPAPAPAVPVPQPALEPKKPELPVLVPQKPVVTRRRPSPKSRVKPKPPEPPKLTQEQKEQKLKETILFRVTGGVPSSKKAKDAE